MHRFTSNYRGVSRVSRRVEETKQGNLRLDSIEEVLGYKRYRLFYNFGIRKVESRTLRVPQSRRREARRDARGARGQILSLDRHERDRGGFSW